MLRIELIGGEKIAAVLESKNERVQSRIESSIGASVLKLQRHIQNGKLSGQVLRVQTGTLRRSIDQLVVKQGDTVTGIVNTNVRYGVMHEYGFSGTVSVKSHLRQMKSAFGRPLKEARFVQIGAHSRQVNVPERSFLRSALRDLKPQIENSLRRAVENAMIENGGAA